MNYYLDTEFYEDGKTIDLISIAIVAEDGREYFAVNMEFDRRAYDDPWILENVIYKLPLMKKNDGTFKLREQIRDTVVEFIGNDPSPVFWAYYADYDWVCFAQLFGRMINLPKNFPMYCKDLKQMMDDLGVDRDSIPFDPAVEHDALSDARWNCSLHNYLLRE